MRKENNYVCQAKNTCLHRCEGTNIATKNKIFWPTSHFMGIWKANMTAKQGICKYCMSLCLFMYATMNTYVKCVGICMHAYVCLTCIYVHTYTHTHNLCMSAYMYIYTYMYVGSHAQVYMYVSTITEYVCICMYACMYTYTYLQTRVCMYVHMYVQVMPS